MIDKADKDRQPRVVVDPCLKGVLGSYFSNKKPWKVIKDLSKQHTGLADFAQAQVHYLDKEIKFSGVHLTKERALLTGQKVMLGALATVVPVLAEVIKRGSSDPLLDDLSLNLLSGVKLLVAGVTQNTLDRRANVKEVLHTVLGKEIVKTAEDIHGEPLPPNEYLLGGKLGDKNKEVIKSAKASDQCLGTKTLLSTTKNN